MIPFKKTGKPIALLVSMVFSLLPISGSAQSSEWKLEDGKAMAKKNISVPGKTSGEIYRNINRWLVTYFKDPEDHIKARIEGEYLRGKGEYPNFFRSGSLSDAYLRYSFIFSIQEEEVIFQLTNAVLIYPSTEENDAVHPVEGYFDTNGKRRNNNSVKVIGSLEEFSNNIFKSFEEYVLKSSGEF